MIAMGIYGASHFEYLTTLAKKDARLFFEIRETARFFEFSHGLSVPMVLESVGVRRDHARLIGDRFALISREIARDETNAHKKPNYFFVIAQLREIVKILTGPVEDESTIFDL